MTDARGNIVSSFNTAKRKGQITITKGKLAAGVYNITLWIDGALADTHKLVIAR